MSAEFLFLINQGYNAGQYTFDTIMIQSTHQYSSKLNFVKKPQVQTNLKANNIQKDSQTVVSSWYQDNYQTRNFNSIVQSLKQVIILVFLCAFMAVVDCKCQKSVVWSEDTQKYNSCEMCYFEFTDHLYFLKCQKKINCQKTRDNKDRPQPFFREYFHSHDQKCQSEMSNIYDTSQCQAMCCQHFNSATLYENQAFSDVYTIQYCKELVEYKSKVIGITALAIAIPLTCLVCCLVINCVLRRSHNHETLAGVFGQAQQSFIKEEQIHMSKFNVKDQGPQSFNAEQSCAVCLDNTCNAYTNCGHYYHPKCLRQWLVKRPRCPVCMSKEYNPVKIYCKSCRIGVKFEVFKRTMLTEQEIKNYQAFQQLLCIECAKNPNKKSKEKLQTKNSSIIKQQQHNLSKNQHQKNEHISIIEFSQQFKDQKNYQNGFQQKVSKSGLKIGQLNFSQGRKSNLFDQSIKEYISRFKKNNKDKSKKIQQKNVKQTPKKQNLDFIQQKQTPNKLIGTQQNFIQYLPSKNSQQLKQTQHIQEFQYSLHSKNKK